MRFLSAKDIVSAANATSIAIASAATVYTKSFTMTMAEYYALCYKATSDGTVQLRIQLEQSYKLPATEGSADANWVVPENMADIEAADALDDETQHHKVLNPICLEYGRFKITGGSSNHSSTVIRMLLSRQEDN